jgi:hypothetical protein
MMSDESNEFRTALAELGAVLDRVDNTAIDSACETLARAKRIGVYGCGREALQIKGFCHAALPSRNAGLGSRRHDDATTRRRQCFSLDRRSRRTFDRNGVMNAAKGRFAQLRRTARRFSYNSSGAGVSSESMRARHTNME